MKGFRTKRALAFVMALVLSFSTFASDFASISAIAVETSSENSFFEPIPESDYVAEETVEEVTEENKETESVEETSAVEEEATEIVEEGLTSSDEETDDALASDEETEVVPEMVEEDAEISYPAINFDPVTINGTTITISAPEGAFPEGTQVSISGIPAEYAVDAVAEEIGEEVSEEELLVFDITFYTEEEWNIQPRCDISVVFNVEECNSDDLEVFHMAPYESEAIEVDATVGDGTAEVVTDEFSWYAIRKDGTIWEYDHSEWLGLVDVYESIDIEALTLNVGATKEVANSMDYISRWKLDNDSWQYVYGNSDSDNTSAGGNVLSNAYVKVENKGEIEDVGPGNEDGYYRKLSFTGLSTKGQPSVSVAFSGFFKEQKSDKWREYNEWYELVDHAYWISLPVTVVAAPVNVSFYSDKNDLTPIDTKTYYVGSTYKDTANAFPTTSKYGYTFKGYFTESGKEVTVKQAVDKNITKLIAKWEPIKDIKVTLDRNGGTAADNGTLTYDFGDEYYNKDQDHTNPLKAPWRTGYDLVGWKVNGGDTLIKPDDNPKAKVTVAEDHKLVAEWAAKEYTITYKIDKNNNPATYSQPVKYDEMVNLATLADVEDVIKKDGYALVGWNTEPNDKTVKHNLGQKIQFSELYEEIHNENFTLYGVFEPNAVTVSFDYNCNNPQNASLVNMSVKFGEAYGNLPNPTRDGYSFEGWKLGDKDITAESIVENNDSHTLKAEWNPVTYKVTLEPGVGSMSKTEYEYTIENSVSVTEEPSAEGYKFLGWKEKYVEDASLITDGILVSAGSTGNKTFVAQWNKTTLSVSADSIMRYYLDEEYLISASDLSFLVKDEADGSEVADAEVAIDSFEFGGEKASSLKAPGEYTIKFTASAAGYEPANGETKLSIEYYVLSDKENGNVNINPGNASEDGYWYDGSRQYPCMQKSGFAINKKVNGEYTGFADANVGVRISSDEGEHEYTYMLKKYMYNSVEKSHDVVGIVGASKYEPKEFTVKYGVDKTAPTVSYSYGESLASKVLNAITFGFYKDEAEVTVSATDVASGVEGIEYVYLPLGESPTDNTKWASAKGNSVTFKVPANFKGTVFAKATDKVGNTCENTSAELTEGVLVVYTAVSDVVESVEYTLTSENSVVITGKANGNEVKSVIIDGQAAVEYDVQYDNNEKDNFTVTIAGEAFDEYKADDYNIIVTFKSLDVDNVAPVEQPQTVKLTVKKAPTTANLLIDSNTWVFDQYDANVNKVVATVSDDVNSKVTPNCDVIYSYAKGGNTDFKNIILSELNNLVPGVYTLKATYSENDKFLGSEATASFTVQTPEVHFYVRRNDGWGYRWDEMDVVSANTISADLFNEAFKDGKVSQYENNFFNYYASYIAETFFAEKSDVISDLRENGYTVSFHKVGLFDDAHGDSNASKHFHVDFDLSKITDKNVSVSMEDWTYGDAQQVPEAKQNTTEPNKKTEKRGGKQAVSYWYTGTIRGEGNERYRQYSSAQVPTQAGTYTVTATFAANDFYNETKATDTFTIAPKVVGVDWKLDGKDKTSVVYDGNVHHVFGVVNNEAYSGENFYVNPIWSENDKTDAGTYKSKAWEVVDSFGFRTYNYTFADEEAFTWTIEQKEVTMHWPSNASFTYNGYDQGYYLPGYENVMFGLDWIGLDGIVKSDEYKVYPVLKGSSLRNTNAGTYHVEATGEIGGERGSNYKLGGFGSHNEWVQTGFFPWMGYNKTVQDVPHFDWTIGQLEAVLSWSGSDTANHSDEDFKFTYSELPYTVSATVTNIQAKDKVTVSEYAKDGYGWNAEPSNKKTYVGKYKAVATKLDNPNYKLPTNASQQFSIDWLIADDATLTGTLGNNGWYGSSVTLSKEDFEIREVTAKTYSTVYVTKWNNSIQKNSETAGANIEYQLKNSEGYITNYKNVGYKIDKSAPTGDVYIGFSSILNNKVFKWFFKDQVFVGVNANDNTSWVGANSGIDKIEYQLLGEDEFKTYNKYLGIKIPANTKTDVLVKITDNAGNVKVLANSDDIIVYTDSEADTENVDYIKTSFEEKAVAVKLNDNTIKAVKNLTTDEVLSEEDYDISGNEIVLKGAYLDSLDAKDNSSADESSKEYEFAVSYNPYNETFTAFNPYARYFDFSKWEWVNNTDSLGFDANDTYFTVNVYKNAEEEVTINALDKTYDGAPVAATFTTVSGRNAVSDNDKFVVEYRANVADQADDAGWSTNAPRNAGSYQVKVTALEDENYYEASAMRDFTIARRHVDVYANDASKMQGDADPTLTVSVDNAIEGVTAYPWRDSGEAPGEYTIHTNVQGDYPNYDVESHQGTFTIAANPALAVLPPAATPTFTPVGPTQVAEVEVEEVEEVVEEAPEEVEVPEEETPLAETPSEEVEIAEEAVPEAAATCIMHWITLGIAVLYAAYALVRALQNKEELDGEEKTAEN